MRTGEEVKKRLENYEQNLKLLKDEEGRKSVRFMIGELRWVLGGEGK